MERVRGLSRPNLAAAAGDVVFPQIGPTAAYACG